MSLSVSGLVSEGDGEGPEESSWSLRSPKGGAVWSFLSLEFSSFFYRAAIYEAFIPAGFFTDDLLA